MAKRYFLLLASIAVLLNGALAAKPTGELNSLYDVFPLRPGLCYMYHFDSYDEFRDGDFVAYSSDIGRIEYRIVDSSRSSDTTIVWHILEIHKYWTTQRSDLPPAHLDTTYLVGDTASLMLVEETTGQHQLTCPGIIWDLPLKHLDREISAPVFRYMDSSFVTLNWTVRDTCGYSSCGGFTDTVVLSTATGFFSRKMRDGWMDGYYTGNSNIAVHQDSIFLSVSDQSEVRPIQTHVRQNFPNPFNPSTTIPFQLGKTSFVSLKIFDLLGRVVETLCEGVLPSGEHLATWSAVHHPSGVYFCRLKTDTMSQTIRLLFIK